MYVEGSGLVKLNLGNTKTEYKVVSILLNAPKLNPTITLCFSNCYYKLCTLSWKKDENGDRSLEGRSRYIEQDEENETASSVTGAEHIRGAFDGLNGEATDRQGRCQTDLSGMNGVAAECTWSQTFVRAEWNFVIGPLPLELSLSMEGAAGLSFKLGPLGNNGLTDPRPCNTGTSAKVCSSTTSCGDNVDPSKGILAVFTPLVSIAIKGEGGVEAVFASAGVGVEVKIVEVKFPLTYEGRMGGESGKNCVSAIFISESLAGRVYLYVDVWLTGRNEWELFSWSGLAVQFPKQGYIGSCSALVGLYTDNGQEMEDPEKNTCQVITYKGKNRGGSLDYRYQVSTNDYGGSLSDWKTKPGDTKVRQGSSFALPPEISNNMKSVMATGICNKVALVDDDKDIGNPFNSRRRGFQLKNAIMDVDTGWVGGHEKGQLSKRSVYDLPGDLRNDVSVISIQSINEDWNVDWDQCCHVIFFGQSAFRGYRVKKKICPKDVSSKNELSDNYLYYKSIKGESKTFKSNDGSTDADGFGWCSLRMSYACHWVKIYDDCRTGWDDCDTKKYYSSASSFPHDFDNDVYKFRVKLRDSVVDAYYSELVQSLDAPAESDEVPHEDEEGEEQEEDLVPDEGEPALDSLPIINPQQEQDCWTCHDVEEDHSFTWRGNETEVPTECPANPLTLPDKSELHCMRLHDWIELDVVIRLRSLGKASSQASKRCR